MNICDVDNPVGKLDVILREGLGSLYRELKSAPWYKREHEIVSLFAFGHLVRLLIDQSIDVGQLDIEGRVPQEWPHRRARRTGKDRAQRDLVIWNRRGDGFWRVAGQPDRPFAVMEWKLSVSGKTRPATLADYQDDIDWLQHNTSLMRVGYAVLVEWPEGKLRLRCAKVLGGAVNRKFVCLPDADA
ncbi:MAG: hypothetical protein ABSF85_00815 [Terriglobales bacterium]|jgi:hypothetical protein